MSGGVDSSVAAALLKKQGYEVMGVHLKCFNVDGCAAQDAEDARRAAEHLGIPFYTFDYEKEYKDKVVEYMIDGYKKGITPNPDVMCNKEIKFGLFYEKAMALGADYIATGHYVRIVGNVRGVRNTRSASWRRSINPPVGGDRTSNIELSLAIAKDRNKDQSYFLWTLKPEQLKHCLFPIGEYKKPQVRKLAVKFGLHNAAKKDSQGICFLGQVSLPDFLKKYIKPKKGSVFLAPQNKLVPELVEGLPLVGTHNGAHFYTIGQRHGFAVSSKKLVVSSKGEMKPHYVVAKDVRSNTITVAQGDDHPALYKKEVILTDMNFLTPVIAIRPAQQGRGSPCEARRQPAEKSRSQSDRGSSMESGQSYITVYARVRYRQPLQKAKLYTPNSCELGDKRKYILRFAKPIKFVAEGQSAVFYNKKGVMLGGGIIV